MTSAQQNLTRPFLVTLVHGTFARGTGWTQPGSTLRRAIDEAMAHHEPGNGQTFSFDVFEWSGRNTHAARIRAGYELAGHIRNLRGKHPDARHVIIAHSHGGNIALLANKHLPIDLQPAGIATLATPFVFAERESHLVGKSLEDLRAEAPKHTGTIANIVAWVVGVPTALSAEPVVQSVGLTEFYWELLAGVVAGLVAALFVHLLFPPLAKFLHRFGAKRAAAKLADAVAFPDIPTTHFMSFTYPGDEAQRLLDALEASTSLPQRGVRFINAITEPGMGLIMGGLILTGVLIGIVQSFFAFDDEVISDAVATVATALIMVTIVAWLMLVGLRFAFSFLRGNPWGFGWERPALHAHVSVGVEPTPRLNDVASQHHEIVPYCPTAVPGGRLRHVGLYEDPRILQSLTRWLAGLV
ncbi:MAG: hypothetical protein AAGG72_00835 [Pseudomonadota bacterium]